MKNILYGTEPLIFHAQGKLKYCFLWESIQSFCLSSKTVPDNLQIVTFNNGKSFFDKIAGCLENSIQNQCVVMGRDIEDWSNPLKIGLVIEFLENSTVPYILSLDSSDIVISSLEGIVERFLSKQCDMLFNAELNCYPDRKHFKFERANFKRPFCHLNAGAWIGKREAALEFYRGCIVEGTSEQGIVKKRYRELYPRVLIDDTCSIFQTLNGVKENILKIRF